MFGNCFRYPVKNAFKIINLMCVLYLNDDDIAFTVLCFDIDTVEFITLVFHVCFTFENFHDMNIFFQKSFEESFEYVEIRIVA